MGAELRKAKAGKRGKGSRTARLMKVLLTLAVVGFIVATPFVVRAAYRYVAARPLFTINEVRVSGLKHVRQDDFINYIGDPKGKSVIDLDVDGIVNKMAAHPWIKDASLKRELPDAVIIEVLERTPSAVAETGSGRFLIDGEGLALARISDGEWDYLPVIRYPAARGLKLIDERAAKQLRHALELLACLRKDPSERLVGAQLSIDDEGAPCMLLEGAVVRVGLGDYEDKVRRLSQVSGDMQKRGVTPSLIDLRFPGKVVVKVGGTLQQAG